MQNNKLKELLNIIDNKVNIVDIVSDYVSLEKKGQNHVGLCPFHSDSNPSMSVSESKGIFKCFSCGAGGGVIGFVQNYEGITFIDAVKKICEKSSINYKEYITQKEVEIDPKLVKAWEINKEAFNFFKYSLENSGKEIKDYISNRGLTKEILHEFKIGYSGEGSSLSNFLLSKGYTEEEIIINGLAKRRTDTILADYFINRLIFPIEDINGNIIGFSGRVLEKDSKYAKYLNSPETSSFKKSNILYNLAKAKTHSSLKKELIVVEGFMDVIALYKSDIKNSIATMGTAFTKEHLKTISSMTKNITLAFDNDAAGINAAISTGKVLANDEFNVNIITIPSGKDFDELLKLGVETVKKTLNKKEPFIDFYKNKIFVSAKGANSVKMNELFEKLSEVLSIYSENKIIIENILNEIKNEFGIEKEIIKEMIAKYNKIKGNFIQNQQFVDPTNYIYNVPIKNVNESVKKYIDNINSNSKTKDFKAKYEFIERAILCYAMKNPEAKSFILENNMSFINENHHKAWSFFLEKDINEIRDPLIKSIIENMLSDDPDELFTSISIFINNMDNFKEVVEKNNSNYKELSKHKLLEELKEVENEEEIRRISKILNDLS